MISGVVLFPGSVSPAADDAVTIAVQRCGEKRRGVVTKARAPWTLIVAVPDGFCAAMLTVPSGQSPSARLKLNEAPACTERARTMTLRSRVRTPRGMWNFTGLSTWA